ncbi:MAG: hypothetical protein KatS3mg105_2814 [Gemmatales bacterium]|nr:MAG: hypothetical protein KatS3mg105_2814 [Gemmatales bacterium]
MNTAAFIDALDGILPAERVNEIRKDPACRQSDAKVLARLLVQRALLTQFQVNQILSGRASTLVVGPYCLLDKLGEGGMGQVYKARHKTTNRIVAVKLIRKEKLNNPNAIKRFNREIKTASQLSSPHVVASYDSGQAGDVHYFAMEYVEGTDLKKLVKNHGCLPVGQACDFIRQAAVGLQHAHEKGMVHRDIKPGNLFATKATDAQGKPIIKILDMGLARAEEFDDQTALTKVGTVVGTPEYLAPEQALDSHRVDSRADLYSLGCTFFYLLTSRPPFKGSGVMDVLIKHRAVPPPDVRELRPEVPQAVAEIIQRLLAKTPDERFQTPQQLVEALQPLCPKDASGWIIPAELKTNAASATKKSTPVTNNVVVVGGKAIAVGQKMDGSALEARKKRRRYITIGGIVGGLAVCVALAVAVPMMMNPDPTADSSANVVDAREESGEVPTRQSLPQDRQPGSEPKGNVETKEKPGPVAESKTEQQAEPIPEPRPVLPLQPKVVAKPLLPQPEVLPLPRLKVEPEPKAVVKKPEPIPEPRPARSDVPDAKTIDGIAKKIRQSKDYQALAPGKQLTKIQKLCDMLLEQARSTKDLNERYVLLAEVRDLGASVGDIRPALTALNLIQEEYEIGGDPIKQVLDVFESASRAARLRDLVEPLADNSRTFAEEMIARDNYTAAERFLNYAETSARKLGDKELLARIIERKKEAMELKKEFAAIQPFLAKLKMDPDEPRANAAVGQFLCLYKENWPEGLPLLARGDNQALREAAQADLKAPTVAAEMMKVADNWWQLAQKWQQSTPKKRSSLRAKFWYEQAVASLEGDDREAVEQRLAAIEKMYPTQQVVVIKTENKTGNEELNRLLRQGSALLNARNFSEAAAIFEQAKELATNDNTRLNIERAQRYATAMAEGFQALQLGEPADAYRAFESALELYPSDSMARLAMQLARQKYKGLKKGYKRFPIFPFRRD